MQNPIYDIHDPTGIKFLTRLRLGLSHLNEHKFKHNFRDCLNPLYSCSLEVESTTHFFLHCKYYSDIRKTLLDTVKEIVNKDLTNYSDEYLVNLFLFGSQSYSFNENKEIIEASIAAIYISLLFVTLIFF